MLARRWTRASSSSRPRASRGSSAAGSSPTSSTSTATATSPWTSSHSLLPETGLRLGRRVWVEAGGITLDGVYTLTFSDVADGQLMLYEDSWRNLALAVNRGSAAELLGLSTGDEVVLRPT